MQGRSKEVSRTHCTPGSGALSRPMRRSECCVCDEGKGGDRGEGGLAKSPWSMAWDTDASPDQGEGAAAINREDQTPELQGKSPHISVPP